MADALVRIRANTSEYQAAMKQAAAEMKKLSSEYSLAAANAKLYGTQSDALRAKVTELTSKMETQKGVVSANEKQYDNLKQKLQVQKDEHEKLKAKVQAAKEAYEASAEATGKNSEESQKLKAEYEKLEARLDSSERAIGKTETAIEKQEAAVTQSKAALAEMEVQLRDVNAELARQKFDEYAEKAEKVGTAVENAGKKMMVVTGAVAAVGTASVKTAMDFDSQMSRVQAISGATGEEFDKLRQQAIDLGASSVYGATEAAEGMENLASAGFTVEETMAAMPGLLNLAASSGEDLATSADIAASAVRGFGLEASETAHVADVLAQNAAATNAAVADTGEALKYVAPVANTAGLSLEEVTAAIGIMANAGIQGSQAGTTLRGALTRLMKPTDAVATAMESLGVTAYDQNGKMKSLSTIVGDLRKATAGLTEEEKQNRLATIFGTNALSGMMALINSSPEELAQMTEELENCDGAAEAMAETMMDNTAGAIEEMKGALETAAIKIGDVLTPYVTMAAKKITELTEKFTNLSPETQKTILKVVGLVAAIGPLLVGIGKVITFTGKVSKTLGTLSAAFTKVGGMAGLAGKATSALSGVFGAITSPIGIAVAAIAVIVAEGQKLTDVYTVNEIYAVCRSDLAQDYFEVMDEIEIALDTDVVTDESIVLQVYGFNHYKKESGEEFAHVVFGMKGTLTQGRKMNSTNINTGGWEASEMRKWLNETMFEALPTIWKSMIESVQVLASIGGQSATIATTIDKLFLFSQAEVGFDTAAVPYKNEIDADAEAMQFTLFTDNASRIKKTFNGEGSAVYWWLRSADSSSSTNFRSVSNGGYAYSGFAANASSVCFGFCVG